MYYVYARIISKCFVPMTAKLNKNEKWKTPGKKWEKQNKEKSGKLEKGKTVKCLDNDIFNY